MDFDIQALGYAEGLTCFLDITVELPWCKSGATGNNDHKWSGNSMLV